MNFLNIINFRTYFILSNLISPLFVTSIVFKRWYIPFNFIPSKLILVIFGVILLPFFISFFIRNKEQILKPFSCFILLYLLFVFFLITRTYFSGSNEYFFITLTSLIQYPFFALAGYFLSFFKKQTVISIFILSSVYFVLSFLMCLKGSLFIHPQSFKSIFGISAKAEYQNINLFLGLFFISSFIFLFINKYYTTFILFIIALMTLFFMSLIGGRGSFLVCLIIFPLMYLSFLSKKNKIISLVVFFICLFIAFFWFSDKSITLWRVGILFTSDDPSSRKTLFLEAIKLFFLTPKTFLFGAGVGGFQEYYGYASLGQMTYPHNFILELLCESGIIGFLLFIGMFYFPYKILVKKNKDTVAYNKYSILNLYIFLFIFIINNFSGSISSLFILITLIFSMFPTQQVAYNKVLIKTLPSG